MGVSLLQTTLFAPSLRGDLVPRPHLIARLAERRRVTLGSAPAGFGKTTLVGAWVADLAATAPPPEQVAWLSLDGADDDPVRFWSYVIAALQMAHPNVGDAALQMLQTPQPPPIETVLTDEPGKVVHEIAFTRPMEDVARLVTEGRCSASTAIAAYNEAGLGL